MTRPRERDWREVIMERRKGVGTPRLGPLQVKVALPFLRLMDAAAQAKGYNRATFIRRSVAVQIATVLDMDVNDILKLCPSAKPFGPGTFNTSDMDDGTGIDTWCPHPGCKGGHLH